MRFGILVIACLILPVAMFGSTARLPVIRDTGVSSERGHLSENSGASVTVPIRQNQNWQGFETKAWLGAFDASEIKGWTVSRAWLNVFLAAGDLYGVGLCTVLSDWEEGRGVNGETGRGGASWEWSDEPSSPDAAVAGNLWAWPGSGVYSVSWFHPDARYHHAPPPSVERRRLEDGRVLHLRFPVDPKLVESLATGFAHGLILTDDKGQVAEGYSLKGRGTPYRYDRSQDIYMYTRDIQDPALRPYLEVEGEILDRVAPDSVRGLRVVETEPHDPSVTVEFVAPSEDGASGGAALGYEARVSTQPVTESGWNEARRLPLWMVPKPEAPGTVQRMRLFEMPPGEYHLALRAVDEAGNAGPISRMALTIPELPTVSLPVTKIPSNGMETLDVTFEDKLELWACPDLCKVDPVTGGILLDGENYALDVSYKRENPVWSGAKRTVTVDAGRGEVAAFQLLLGRLNGTRLSNVRVNVSNLSGDPMEIRSQGNVDLFRVWYLDVVPRPEELVGPWELVEEKDHKPAWHGDACLPLQAPFDLSFGLPSADNMGDFQLWQSVWVDMFIPPSTRPGLYQGRITVTAEELDRPAILILMLNVLPFTIPDRPTWLIDLNCYAYGITDISGVKIDEDTRRYLNVERGYYQVGHAHRSTLNILPYNQDGSVQMLAAPELQGSGSKVKVSSWNKWDERYGPYLSGRAFTPSMGYSGPGQGRPLTHIYLPFHENWPLPIAEHYGDYTDLETRDAFVEWAKTSRSPEEAFDEEYKLGFSSVVRQFFEYFDSKKYRDTAFQVYFNNKYYFKVSFFQMRNEGRGSSFWLLDEPVDYDDYEANRFYMELVRRGYEASGKKNIELHYRTDVSQPEMTRGLWDGLCNLWNNSGLLGSASTAMFRMRRLPGENHWRYGGAPRISGRLIELQHNFLTLWAVGANGALPYWNVLGGGDWFNPDDLSVYYTGTDYARSGKTHDGALPGVRLKMIRRAQQDVEYLNLLAAKKGWNYYRLRRALAPWADDPEVWPYSFFKLDSDRLVELRRTVATELSKP